MKRLFYLLVFVVISVKADMLVLKDGKEINGKLISIEKNILTFSTDNKEITEELSNVIRLKFQKMREGGTAETIDKLPDKWLRNRIKKGLPTTKDYPDSGSIILRNNTIVTLTSPQIWTIQKQKTILILKERGRRRAIRTLNYFHDYEKAEIIHAWSIAPNGKVLHLQDNSMTREKIYSSSPRYNSVTRIRFSMQGTDIGSIIDIKSKERRIKPREFDTFYMETPFTSSIPAEKETITIITPSKKQWSLDYHISNNLSSLKNQITYSKTVENSTIIHSWERKNIEQNVDEPYSAPNTMWEPTLCISATKETKMDVIKKYSHIIEKTLKNDTKQEQLSIPEICNNFAGEISLEPASMTSVSFIPNKINITREMKSGNDLDRTILLLKELLDNDYEAEMLLVKEKHSADSANLFSMNMHSTPSIRVKYNGKWEYPTPTSINYLFPETSPYLQGAEAICVWGKSMGKEISIPLNNPQTEKSTTILNITKIDPSSGNISVTLQMQLTGWQTHQLRSLQLSNDKDIDTYIKQLNCFYYPTAETKNYKVRSEPRNCKTQVLTSSFTVSGYVNNPENGKFLIFKTSHYSPGLYDVGRKKRIAPIVRNFLTQDNFKINITIPNAYTVNYVPKEFRETNALCSYSFTTMKRKRNILTINYSETTKQTYVPATTYKTYKNQKTECAKRFEEFIVLKKTK